MTGSPGTWKLISMGSLEFRNIRLWGFMSAQMSASTTMAGMMMAAAQNLGEIGCGSS